MICPKCQLEQPDTGAECLGCGVVFAKVAVRSRPRRTTPRTAEEPEPPPHILAEYLLHVDEKVHPVAFGARALLLVALGLWSLALVTRFGAAGQSFLHSVNLPFHEAGHIIFMPLGRFLMFVGGSLTQILVPLVCAATLVVKTRDPFGGAVCVWWAGENLLDLAPYVADARSLSLVLIGGRTGAEVEGHDWEAILGTLGLLSWDVTLGRLFHSVGTLVMIGALGWATWLLLQQRRRLSASSF